MSLLAIAEKGYSFLNWFHMISLNILFSRTNSRLMSIESTIYQGSTDEQEFVVADLNDTVVVSRDRNVRHEERKLAGRKYTLV